MSGNVAWNAITWTKQMERYLKTNFNKKTNVELAAGLGLRLTSVRTRCYKLGLKKLEMEYWTPEQERYLKRNYKLVGDTEIAEYFNSIYDKQKGWSKKHIEKKRRYLKLKRTGKQIKAVHQRNVEAGRFKLCPVKAWQTRGGMAEVGIVRIWGHGNSKPYKVIKTEKGFVHYAHWLYIQTFGQFPPGHVIGFKDRDNMNVVPENLEAITRAEHASRNRTKFKDLWEVIKTLEQLNKTIKSKAL